MKRHGRVNLLAILATIGVAGILALLFFSQGTPTQSANDFLTALAKGDPAKLTELSYMDGKSKEEIQKDWEYTTQVAGPHYHFRWLTVGETKANEEAASVRIKLFRNSRSVNTYDENFAVPMIKDGGKWKVDVRALSREMFPGLPR